MSCAIDVTVNVDGVEKSSILYHDLTRHFSNHEKVVAIYAIATNIKSSFKAYELDENGEPKLDAVIKKLSLDKNSVVDLSEQGINSLYGFKKDGEYQYFKTFENAFEKINDINKLKGNKICIIKHEDKKGYYVDVVDFNDNNNEIYENQKVAYELNPKFKRILNSFGFDIQRINNLEENGVFSPEDAVENANGMIDIIKLSKGLEGDYALSEEFCHFVIAGLRDNPLVKRMINAVNDDIAKDILGGLYDSYKNKYKKSSLNDNEINLLLREEAVGKLLSESLSNINKKQEFVNNTLFKRFEDSIRKHLADKDESLIENAIIEAKQTLLNIVDKISTLDEDFFANFSKKDVLSSKNLFQIKKETKSKIEKLSGNILEIALKENQIAAIKAPGSTADERKEFITQKQEKLERTKTLFNNDEHAYNCLNFLYESTAELEELIQQIEDVRFEIENNKKNYKETVKFGKCCYILNSIKDFASSYREVVTKLNNLDSEDEKDLTDEQKADIKEISGKLLGVISTLELTYKEARFDIIKYWLETYYWKDNIKTGVLNDKGEEVILTLESLLREAPKDINMIDLYISEMGHCSDIMLNLLSTIHKKQMARRDQRLEEIYLRINKIHKDLSEDTSFMYERKNGQLTGRIISNIDYDKFEEEYNKYKKQIYESELSESKKSEEIQKWHINNTEEVVVDTKNNRSERLPKKSKYGIAGWDSRLTYKQKEYYNEMMELKAEMETLLGPTNYHIHVAPQMSSDYIQKFTDGSSFNDKMKFAFSELKHQVVREADDIEFGELDKNGVRKVAFDMQGNPIKKIPVYFVHKLKDMNRLNTDFSKGISAYSAMSVNYNEMSKIINQIETFKDLLLDRGVSQYSGDSVIMNVIKSGQNIAKEKYLKRGSLTNIGERLQKYIDMNFYGMQKEDEGTIKILNKQLDQAKTIDNVVKGYSGLVNLGINPFSGFSNISMGEVQMLIEAMANSGMSLFGAKKDTFGIRDLLWAHKEYAKDLPQMLIDAESMSKKSKVGLLMRKFDVEQSFFDKLKESGFYSNAAKRWFGNNSLSFIMQNAGEHYLHTNLMLAMLHSKKVLLNGKEVSLFDAYEVKDNKIVEKGEIKELDGSKFTNDKFIDFKLKIQELSHQFNGAFGSEDLGTLQQKSWGRLIMQFRQWMPGHWGRRFARKYYNTATKQYQEGYWITSGRVAKEIFMSLIKTKRSIPEYWGSLTNYEKTNIMKAAMETMLLMALSFMIRALFAGDDDDDDEEKSRMRQFLKYQCYRTYMEMVSTCPLKPNQMVKNTFTMLQSPAAAIKTFDNVWNLVRLDHLFDEVESGTYKGMSVYHRDLLKAIPYYGQMRKVWDLSTEEYMFNLFKEK